MAYMDPQTAADAAERDASAARVEAWLDGYNPILPKAGVRTLLRERAELLADRVRMAAELEPAAPIVDGTTVHTRATTYTVSCLPDDPIDGDLFAITVEFRGGHAWGEPRPLDQQWAVVMRGHWNLGHDGQWSLKPSSDDEGYERWITAHRFDLETALKRAAEQAPTVTINGSTPADVLARRARR